MKTDSLFYQIFLLFPDSFFDLIGQPQPGAANYQFTSQEVKQLSFRLDGLFMALREDIQQPLYLVEVQFQPDDTLYYRLFAELFLFLKQYQPPHPWQIVVIYPHRGVERETPVLKASDLSTALGTAIAGSTKGVELKLTSLEYDAAKRQVKGVMQLTAQDAWVKQGLRFGVMLREQGVRGLGTGWDQKVDFHLTKDSQSVFFGKNKTLVGYHHNRVVWGTVGGKHGDVMTTGAEILKLGDKQDFSFTLAIPDSMLSLGMPKTADFGPTVAIYSRFKPADMSVVGFVASDFGAGISETVNLGEYSAPILSSVSQPLWDIQNDIVRLDSKQDLNLYPNPATGWVSLDIKGNITEVMVFDVSGRVLQGLIRDENRLDLSSVTPGLYFVRVKTHYGIGTARLLVN